MTERAHTHINTIYKSPHLVSHSAELDKRMSGGHHYGITRNNFTALNIHCSSFSLLP